MAILKPSFNINYEVALKFAGPGIDKQGSYGPQKMFTLLDPEKKIDGESGEFVLYLDLPVAQRLEAMNLAAGERFDLLKREKKLPNGKKGAEWVFAKVGVPQQPVSRPAAAAAAPVVSQNGGGTHQPQATTDPAPVYPIAAGRPFEPPITAGFEASFRVTQALSHVMTECFMSAIDAIAAATEYAKRKGMALAFNEEDVRTTANSLLIQRYKDAELMARQQQRGAAWRN